MSFFFVIWFLGTVILGAIAAFKLGQMVSEKKKISDDDAGAICLGIMFWPIVLLFLGIISPFIFFYKLGLKKDKK